MRLETTATRSILPVDHPFWQRYHRMASASSCGTPRQDVLGDGITLLGGQAVPPDGFRWLCGRTGSGHGSRTPSQLPDKVKDLEPSKREWARRVLRSANEDDDHAA